MSDAPAQTFTTTIELSGKTATGFRVPVAVVEALSTKKRLPVYVTIGGHTYRSTLTVYRGDFMVPLSAENRDAAGVAAGDEVEVTLAPDNAPREVELPADFAAALEQEPEARQAFDSFHYSSRRRMVLSIEEAKTAATRERRIAKALDTLRVAPRGPATGGERGGHDGAADDFPAKLGQPARRALAGAGYERLEQLTEASTADILKLHGMGPKALGQLRQALAERGQSFADEA